MGESKNENKVTYEYEKSGILKKEYTFSGKKYEKGTLLIMNDDPIHIFVKFYLLKAFIRKGTTEITHFDPEITVPEDNDIFEAQPFKIPQNLMYTSLTTLHLDGKLSDYIFFNSNLEEFEGNCELGVGVFSHCKKLRKVKLKGIEHIPNETFFRCESLEDVTVNGETLNVRSIGKRAFQYCYALKNIIFDRITKIEERAFNHCNNLQIIELPGTVQLHKKALSFCRKAMVIIHGDTGLIPVDCLKFCHSVIRHVKPSYDVSKEPFRGLFIDTVENENQPWTWYFFNGAVDRTLFELYISAKMNNANITNLKQYNKNILRGLFRKEIKEKRTKGTEYSGQISEMLNFLDEVGLTDLDPIRDTRQISYNKPLFSMLSYELSSRDKIKADETYRFFGESLALCFRASSVSKRGYVFVNAYMCQQELNLLDADCWRNQLYDDSYEISTEEYETRLYNYCKSKGLDGWHMRCYSDNNESLDKAEYEVAISVDIIFDKLKFHKMIRKHGSELKSKYFEDNLVPFQHKMLESFIKLRM